MPKRYKVKITVFKRFGLDDVFGIKPPKLAEEYENLCPLFKEGDIFIVEHDGKIPEGFCHWTWADLHREIMHLRFGGDFPWFEEKGVIYSSCTDGLRPVVFKLEKMEEQSS